MNRPSLTVPGLCLALLFTMRSTAQTPRAPQTEVIEVTASRIAEDVSDVPLSITVIDGDELRARNARDLQSALGLVSGVSIAPGGDAGPAGAVPEMWGLREFDAYLLVVDDVPWGGAFNPDTATLILDNIDRIEIVRGSAPVMYGATSFVGVIHVIHRIAGSAGREGRVMIGNYGSGGASASLPLTQSSRLRQSISAGFDRRGYRDDHTSFDRGNVLYRLASEAAAGTWRLDASAILLRQQPASPHVREGRALSRVTPLDSNYNPRGAKLDENRFQLAAGWDSSIAGMPWTTKLSATRSDYDILRGFLTEVSTTAPNAAGFRQDRVVTDVYFDTHLVKTVSPAFRLIAGLDYLHGRGTATSGLFDYFAPLAGSRPPAGRDLPSDEVTKQRTTRNFSGLYATAEWTPAPGLRIDGGVRLNETHEKRVTHDAAGADGDRRATRRPGAVAGINYKLWSSGGDSMGVFANYRNTFKPAATDFGPEAEPEILRPETATSYEAGVRGRLLDGRWRWSASLFDMNFHGLVVSTSVHGLPALANAGNERFTGAELESDYLLTRDLRWELAYSYHDARFRDYSTYFGPTLTQLSGKRLEMSPLHLAATGFTWFPGSGFNATTSLNLTGPRYLNKRNTAPVGSFVTLSAGAGYRFRNSELRLDGRNLSDRRDPVSESELGDAQYYLMQSRSIELTYRMTF